MREYISQGRLIELSKTTNTVDEHEQMRPIVVMSNFTKVLEKAIQNKLKN